MVCGLFSRSFQSLSFTCLTGDYLSKLNIIDATETGKYLRNLERLRLRLSGRMEFIPRPTYIATCSACRCSSPTRWVITAYF